MINVNLNGNTWAALVIPDTTQVVTQILVNVTQASAGVCQAGIYQQSNMALLSSTNTVSTTPTGVKTLTLTTPVTLVAGQFYYIAVTAPTANGSMFGGWVNAATQINTAPIPAINASGSLPATLPSSGAASAIWALAT